MRERRGHLERFAGCTRSGSPSAEMVRMLCRRSARVSQHDQAVCIDMSGRHVNNCLADTFRWSESSLARISLTGHDFTLSTGTEDFLSDLRQCAPCEPNLPVSLGARWAPTGFNGGSATGVWCPLSEVFFGPGSTGTFTTSTVTLAGSGPVTVTLPFTFRGTVTGFASSQFDHPVFTTALVGSGTARADSRVRLRRTTLFSATDLPGADFQLHTYSPARRLCPSRQRCY